MVKRKEVFTNLFDNNFDEIFNFIEKNSSQNALKFVALVDNEISNILNYPKAYPPEPYLYTVGNLYRFAKVMKSWKIIFKVTQNVLVFLAIIHKSQNPKEIKRLRTSDY
jgi:hypothetical protein